ncbi:TetR/AcrR family transcriptional regulator [Endozoicomonas sp. G2_2]|uniref:TetR/AcrR family transcriptional regulator n=1 Tax=Endozoicomonas sp. G2_2 TaxID=2821092 RepID=UPI001AD9F07E|nr:TetR/AcrR family transcriptional regulator [Endozoicomonas sp. G2_2]MBO9469767.1 TetR/AcrR family transcriptional regulator [Endozoicomonas sp. G2_2]
MSDSTIPYRPATTTAAVAARERIEAAALDLFAERAFHEVRLDEIARAARASLQTIYRHYGDKQALLDACVLNWANALAARMTDHLIGIETYKDRLRKVFWVVLDFFEQHPKVARMILGSVYPGAMRYDVTAEQRRLTNLFMEVLAEGRERGILNDQVSEAILLDYFYGVLARLIQMQNLRQQEPPLSQQVNVLFEMLWRAIAKP